MAREDDTPNGTMTWINIVSKEQAKGRLREVYVRVAGPDGKVDNVLRIHSLRPHTLEGHIALYKSVLHNSGNKLPKWLLETIGVYVSRLNGCTYCVDHHFAGLRRLLKNDDRAQRIRRALETGNFEEAFDRRERAILDYARQLTQAPDEIRERSVAKMRTAGLDDGEILEVNQVASYFAYVNRTVLRLGVTTKGDTLGLSPSDSADPENWQHT
jgi:uncharacterized peroxidase-related enzyme